MSQDQNHSPRAQRGGGAYWAVRIFAAVLLIIGLPVFAGGIWLIALGGSWYYAAAGIGLLVSSFLLFKNSPAGLWVYLLTFVLTVVWAVWEVGLNGWALVPRIVAPAVLAAIAVLLFPAMARRQPASERRPRGVSGAAATTAGVVVIAVGTAVLLMSHGTSPAQQDQQGAPQAQEQQAQDQQAQDQQAPAAQDAQQSPAAAQDRHMQGGANAPAAPGETTGEAAMQSPGASTQDQPRPAMTAKHTGDDWPVYGGDIHATRYSPLDQINTDNVSKLEKVWTFRTGDLPKAGEENEYSPETTPIEVGGRIYVCSAKNQLIALDGATGREQWRYDPGVSSDAIPYGATCRGVAYYEVPDAPADQPCATRIIEGTLDARLIAVDAETGKLCPDFGTNGTVDLMEGMGSSVPGLVAVTSPPTIVRGIAVVGDQVNDGQAEDVPSGVIRGYDAVTGELAWAWDMGHPERHGAPPAGETYTRGTPNAWTTFSGDEELGLVYVPLGNSAVDYFGGNRSEVENKYSSSLVALNVETGEPAWSFQTVHYDVWDYDLGSQATLVDMPMDGESVPALILPSKQGYYYVLDRRTGKPLTEVKEVDVPQGGGVEADKLSKTQPASTGFPDAIKPPLKEADMWGATPVDQLWCRIQYHRTDYRGPYTPPASDRAYLEYPGYNGGSDWGGVAVDEERGIMIANYNDMPNRVRLIPRKEADARGWKPMTEPGGPVGDAPQAGAPYATQINAGWRLITGMMCKQPPYGGIMAVDLKTRKVLWDEPLGEARRNGPFGIPSMLPVKIGTPNNGGAVVTAGGLIFIAAATDDLIRAIDIETGKVVWEDTLPAGGQATPMTYEVDGRQYIGFMAGGHHFMETPVGDYVLAYALPE